MMRVSEQNLPFANANKDLAITEGFAQQRKPESETTLDGPDVEPCIRPGSGQAIRGSKGCWYIRKGKGLSLWATLYQL